MGFIPWCLLVPALQPLRPLCLPRVLTGLFGREQATSCPPFHPGLCPLILDLHGPFQLRASKNQWVKPHSDGQQGLWAWASSFGKSTWARVEGQDTAWPIGETSWRARGYGFLEKNLHKSCWTPKRTRSGKEGHFCLPQCWPLLLIPSSVGPEMTAE